MYTLIFTWKNSRCIVFFKIFLLLERAWVGVGAKVEGENPKKTPMEHGAHGRAPSHNPAIMTPAEIKSWMFKWATQAPHRCVINTIMGNSNVSYYKLQKRDSEVKLLKSMPQVMWSGIICEREIRIFK